MRDATKAVVDICGNAVDFDDPICLLCADDKERGFVEEDHRAVLSLVDDPHEALMFGARMLETLGIVDISCTP